MRVDPRDVLARVNAASDEAERVRGRRMRQFWWLALWGSTATAALAFAVVVSRSEVGTQRAEIALASLSGRQPAPVKTFDAEKETRQLRDALRALAEDRDRLTTRVASIEQNLDVVTGSVTRELEAVRSAASAAAAPWPADPAPEPTPPEAIAATVAPAATEPAPTGLPVPDVAPAAAAAAAVDDAVFGADLGGAPTIQALRLRWETIRSAHPRLFADLRPVVSVRDMTRSNRVELRLVVGPLSNAGAAAQLCAAVSTARQSCRPARFDGQRLALH